MNFAERLIEAGFENINIYKLKRIPRPTDGFLGANVYVPDAIYRRDNKKVHIALGSWMTPTPIFKNKEEYNKFYESWNRNSIYIGLWDNDRFVYQHWFQQLPDEEIIKKFLCKT